MTDLDALKAALEKATPGEWKRVGPQKLTIRWGQGIENTTAGGKIGAMSWRNGPENAAAIVLAVNTLRQPGALEALALGRRIMASDEALVEAVARGMASDGFFSPDERMKNGDPRWRYYVPLTRAALAAVKEVG